MASYHQAYNRNKHQDHGEPLRPSFASLVYPMPHCEDWQKEALRSLHVLRLIGQKLSMATQSHLVSQRFRDSPRPIVATEYCELSSHYQLPHHLFRHHRESQHAPSDHSRKSTIYLCRQTSFPLQSRTPHPSTADVCDA